MSEVLTRQCPTCGARWASLYCGNDGSVTVLRPDAVEASRAPLPVGAVIEGRYLLTQVIGKGAFGAVYAADQFATGQQVAIKVLHADLRDGSEVARRRFAKESRVLARLRHPSTVRVYDVGITADHDPYFVMELVPGLNLEQVFAGLQASGRRFFEHEAIDLILPVLGSLAEAHGHGLVHRDVKPANLMVSHVADDGLVVKVVDFGVVRTEGSMLTARASALGTPRYMSPEQCRGLAVDARSDLYSVACVLFEAMSGRPPLAARSLVDTVVLQVSAPPPSLADAGVAASPELEAVLVRLLRKEPDQRFASAGELRAALVAIRTGVWGDQPAARIADILPEFEALTGLRLESSDRTPQLRGATSHSQVSGPAGGAASAFELPEIPNRPSGVQVAKAASAPQATPMFSAAASFSAGHRPDPSLVGGTGDIGNAERKTSPEELARYDQATRVRHVSSRPTPLTWAPVDSTMENSQRPNSNAAVRLPHPRELEAAIAARQAFLAQRDRVRVDNDTRVDFDDQRKREIQVAPEAAVPTERKPLGRGTILGTGLVGRNPRNRDKAPESK